MPQTPTDEERWSQAAAWSRSTHLNELETTMWRSERHPEQSSTIAALLILDRAPEAERLAAAHAWAAELVPRVRQRVVEPLLPTGPPAWVNDNDFDLGYHLRRQLIWPGSERKALLGMVRTLLLTPFDRRRPLWEATLIEGLAGGRAAYLLKAHHSLADGVGMIQLLSGLNSRTRGHIADKPVTAATDPVWQQTVSPWEVTVDGVSAFVRAAVDASPDVLGGLAGAVLNPVAALSASQRYLASFRRTVIPPDAGTQSPLLRRRTGRSWSLRYLDCSLAELRAAGKAAGGSINDAYLAALLGGLRRYHERHDVVVDDIPITVPVSLRGASDPLGGNKFAGAVLPGPVGVVDPVERIAQVRGLMLAATTEPALDAFSVMAPLVNRLPSVVGSTAMRLGARNDLAASNVPGIREQVYLAGARVEQTIPFGPLPGVAMMAVMTSYVERCSIGLTLDSAAFPDADVLESCCAEGLEEVLAVGRPL